MVKEVEITVNVDLFKIGDRIIKDSGDYTFEGEIRGYVLKKSGKIRYVAEDDRGLLFIFNASQIRKVD